MQKGPLVPITSIFVFKEDTAICKQNTKHICYDLRKTKIKYGFSFQKQESQEILSKNTLCFLNAQ